MRAHYLQHVPFEGLGSIEAWLVKSGYEISCTQFYESPELPQIEEIDLLIIMGGPMSVKDEADYPWLAQEKAFVRSAILAGKPTLGVCLGAQLMADSMGGEVYPNSVKEIGWFPVQAVSTANEATFAFPDEIKVFHWHGETYSLPEGAVLLAESEGCRNQAFQIGRRAVGLQFHLETTSASAQSIVEHCSDELVEGQYIQAEAEILSVPQRQYVAINQLMDAILSYLCSS